MRKYPAYKDSGIDWIGKFPEHWNQTKLKYVLNEPLKYGANESGDIDDVSLPRYIRITDFDDSGNLRNDTFRSLPLDIAQDYFLQEGDILFARSGATVGKTFQFKCYNGMACFAGYLIKASPNPHKILSDYLYYYTKSNAYENWKDSIFNQATIQNIGADKYQYLNVVSPPIDEQQAIVDFLDKKTARIDDLIAKKERQIDLLKEQRQAVINQAITKGLNPDVKMKDSGIEWLGEIPMHWEVMKITSACSKINDGTHFSPESDFTGERLYITAKNIKENGVQISNATYITEEAHRIIYQRCPVIKGDVLYIKDGATAGIATVNQLDEEFSLLSSVALIRPVEETLLAKFLAYQLNDSNFKSCVLNNLVGGAMTRFTVEIIKRFRLVVPPVAEQNVIVKYLDNATKEVAFTISKAEKQIQLLQEYRTALISEAVTGKIMAC